MTSQESGGKQSGWRITSITSSWSVFIITIVWFILEPGFEPLIGIVGSAILGILAFKQKSVALDKILSLLVILTSFCGVLFLLARSSLLDSPPITDSSPTLVPLSALDEIGYDDFSSLETGWDTGSTNFGYRGYENNRYLVRFAGESFLFSAWRVIGKVNDVVLQVDVLGPFDEADKSKRGIGFGSQTGGNNGTYAFAINSSGMCEFLQYIKDDEYEALEVESAGYIAGFDDRASHYTLRVYIRYNEAVGYVNGEFCASYLMPDYQFGYVGLAATPSITYFDGSKGESYFDEYHVYQLP